MSQIINDFNTGTITITEEYNLSATQSDIDATPYFNSIDDEYVVSFIELDRVEKFTKFEFETIGGLQTRYLETYYRISRNGTSWSEYQELEEDIQNFPPFDPLDKMWIDIKFIRSGEKTDGSIRLISFKLTGDLLTNSADGTVIISSGLEGVIKPPYVYKVFRIDNIEVITSSSLTDLDLSYRYSQDNARTWSEWEPLTKENISTKRINPVRFFQIEYLVKNNSSSSIKIQDINLIGDFQNVTLDSQKTNLFGIRECCQSALLASAAGGSNAGVFDANGIFIPNSTGVLNAQACTTDNIFKPMTADEKSKLYNPYEQTQALNLLNKLTNDAIEIAGHKVQYFVTDPDGKGIDYTLHEFGLFNIVCEGELKVIPVDNKFPDNQIVMNVFDLSLFESFEVHVTKEAFKALFGVQRRPSKEDLVYFCDINRLFIVDHAQQFRNFNNYAVYYKVILKKYNKSANVIPGEKSIEDRINELTNNSTIDQLFGIENDQDKAAVANKTQTQPLSRDPIRVTISNIDTRDLIVKELIENSTNIISKQHYDFSNALKGGSVNTVTEVIKYKGIDARLKISDNFAFCTWFNINNYVEDEVYNFFDYYNTDNNIGWKINLSNDIITMDINSDSYEFNLGSSPGIEALYEDVWYCYIVNVDQRNRKINQYIYKRDVENEDDAKYSPSTILKLVYSDEQVQTPVQYELEETSPRILISDIKMTNLRLFTDVVPVEEHSKILNQYVIADDAKYLVFADNANLKIVLPNFPFGGSGFERPV